MRACMRACVCVCVHVSVRARGVHMFAHVCACGRANMNTNARLIAFALSPALDPTVRIHSHNTLDTAQPCHLLKPN